MPREINGIDGAPNRGSEELRREIRRIHMRILCETCLHCLAIKCAPLLFKGPQTTRAASRGQRLAGATPMQDLLWIGIILALLAASLGYVRLCDDA
jgi:hypothetical protein